MRTLDALPSKQGRKPKHDWDAILNGQVNVVGHGEDFDCTVDSFISQARGQASKRGLTVTAIKLTERDGGRTGLDGTIEDGQRVEVPLDVAVQAKAPGADEAEAADEEE